MENVNVLICNIRTDFERFVSQAVVCYSGFVGQNQRWTSGPQCDKSVCLNMAKFKDFKRTFRVPINTTFIRSVYLSSELDLITHF